MNIDEGLLRKYIFHNQVFREHSEAVAETYLGEAYEDVEEIENDMKYTLKRAKNIEKFEEELLKELNKDQGVENEKI